MIEPVTFEDGTVIAHDDYPHLPGRLWGCPACESTCLCTGYPGDAQCVFCVSLEKDYGHGS